MQPCFSDSGFLRVFPKKSKKGTGDDILEIYQQFPIFLAFEGVFRKARAGGSVHHQILEIT